MRVVDFRMDEENNRLEVVFREPRSTSYARHGGPDLVWREFYEVVDGKIKCTCWQDGILKPADPKKDEIVFPHESPINHF